MLTLDQLRVASKYVAQIKHSKSCNKKLLRVQLTVTLNAKPTVKETSECLIRKLISLLRTIMLSVIGAVLCVEGKIQFQKTSNCLLKISNLLHNVSRLKVKTPTFIVKIQKIYSRDMKHFISKLMFFVTNYKRKCFIEL